MRLAVKILAPVCVLTVAAMVAVPVGIIVVLGSTGSETYASLVDCTAPATNAVAYTTSSAQLTASQLSVADTIIGVAESDPSLGQQAAVIGIMTAMQESTLADLTYGDRDSLGAFQQRASQGWGTPAEEENVTDAAEMFYGTAPWMNPNKGLKQVAGWQQMAPADAAQRVQGSANGALYAQWQGMAEQLVSNAHANGAQVQTDDCTLTSAAQGPVSVPANVQGQLPAAVVAEIGQAPPQVQTAIQFALKQVGTWYQWGGTGPRFDCSGLWYSAYQQAGVAIPRTSQAQWSALPPVSLNALKPGDLVFYEGEPPGHVVGFLGWDGTTGWVEEAAETGTQLRVEPMYAGAVGAARVVQTGVS